MRKAAYLALLALILAVPVERADVGKLRPVEVIALAEENGTVTVCTDTGDWGEGASLREAMDNLRDTTPGVVYLDTAEYLLLETEVTAWEDLGEMLKESVRVCAAQRGISLEGSGAYLDIHRPDCKLGDGIAYQKLRLLTEEDGRFLLQ